MASPPKSRKLLPTETLKPKEAKNQKTGLIVMFAWKLFWNPKPYRPTNKCEHFINSILSPAGDAYGSSKATWCAKPACVAFCFFHLVLS